MSESKKKSLKEKLSDTAAEVNRGGDFEKLSGELQSDIQQVAVNFNEKIQEVDDIDAEKKNSKVRYQRALDEGDEQGMSLCLSEIRGRNVQGGELRAELTGFTAVVKELYSRQTKIFAIARDGQSKAEADLHAAEKALKLTEGRIKRCYALQGLINSVNKDIEDLTREHKREKKSFENEIKTPRSNKDGFWLEVDDPFAQGELRHYEELKDVDGLSLPLMLNFKDKEKAPVDEEGLKNRFEKSEKLKSEFGDLKTYIEFESLIVVQILKSYVVRANGGGDRRRGFAAQAALQKSR